MNDKIKFAIASMPMGFLAGVDVIGLTPISYAGAVIVSAVIVGASTPVERRLAEKLIPGVGRNFRNENKWLGTLGFVGAFAIGIAAGLGVKEAAHILTSPSPQAEQGNLGRNIEQIPTLPKRSVQFGFEPSLPVNHFHASLG